ncbi:MAG TPA: translocation/assembly module TamB domain-containing protein, partial [Burkholderiaceae bacterium]|nr:translocation/assembly module TamB domain-containing protein [Burkholderiaceae bacterium]
PPRGGPGAPPNAARGPQRSQLFDLRIDLGQKLSIAGRGLATRLTGELRLTSPGGKIAVHGDVHAEDGSYTAYGQKMTIDRGSVLFGGAADNPRLDIAASKRDLDDVRVGVTVTGTAQNPRIRLFSEPEMTETDKLSYLLLGRASDGLGRTDLALLQRAAIALITGEDDSPGLIERIGLDQFSVRKDESTTPTGSGAASSTTRDTVVSLGKQLSRRWYLGYERSLNAASGTWQLIYKLAQRFTFRAQTGAENALDLIWTWKWGTPGLTVLPIAGGAVPPAGAAAPASAAETRPVR